MAELISKLQYKTCEDGEYYDEKPRNLEETIELVKNFPWVREQYADLGLTGPSITIQDKKGNFLKAGIYYGGRFSLYYLDANGHYYAHTNIAIEKVYNAVIAFFNDNLVLDSFEKHSFQSGKKKYFTTSSFEYRLSFWKVLLLNIWWFFYLLFFSVIAFVGLHKDGSPFYFLFIIVAFLFGYVAFNIFEKYYQNRKQYLKISRGESLFWFGNAPDEILPYNKADIEGIICYSRKNFNDPYIVEVFEIKFKNGESIAFTNALISYLTLNDKFSDKWKLSIDNQYVGLGFFRIIP